MNTDKNNTQLPQSSVTSSVFLQIGMKVKIKTDPAFREESGKTKTITADLPNYNGERAFQLDDKKDEIWLIKDFEHCINYPKLSMR